MEIPERSGEGGGGYILWVDFGKSRGEAGSYGRSPPLGWYGYFLEPLDFAWVIA